MSKKPDRKRPLPDDERPEQAAPPDAAGGQGSFTRPEDVAEVPPADERTAEAIEPTEEPTPAPPLHRDAPPSRWHRGT